MFDIGWMEILVVAVVAVVVVGPQELPRVLANMGRWVAKGRAVAREFQDSVHTVIREAELEDLRVDLPDPNKIFGENPITTGKSAVGGGDAIPEDQFIDDELIAEMEAADALTVEAVRKATVEGDRVRAEAEAETVAKTEPAADSKIIEPVIVSAQIEPKSVPLEPTPAKTAADT